MAKSKKASQPFITAIPVTAEAQEAMIDSLFADTLPHYGELFVPGDEFYINLRGPQQAQHMLVMLCLWLGIKPGYIGLEFEGVDGYVADGQRHTIYVEAMVLWNEFLLGATLAYGLTRYLIEERKQVILGSDDQPALLATGSVVFGLGIVVINGFLPSNKWLTKFKRLFKMPLENYFSRNFMANYEGLVRGFMKSHGIGQVEYGYCLAPWASKKLGSRLVSKPTKAVHEARHINKVAQMKLIGVLWLVTLAIGIGSFVLYNHAQPQSAQTVQAQDKANMLQRLTNECKDSLAYERQYADLTDIQTVRSLNAIDLRCQSLNNQYQASLDR